MNPQLLQKVNHIICHARCPDGIASVLILADALPGANIIELIQYNSDEHIALEAKKGMIFCDIVPHQDNVRPFVDAGAIVLDHHKGAEGIIKQFGDRGVYSDEPCVSGAMLAYRKVWQVLQNCGSVKSREFWVKDFAHLAGVRDTWQTQHRDWKKACQQAMALMFYPENYWLPLNSHKPFLAPEETDVGKILYEKRMVDATRKAEELYLVADNMLNLNMGFFNDRDKLTSDVCEAVRASGNKNNLDFVCGFNVHTEPDKIYFTYSLRSIESCNVMEIAKLLGGGGHEKAAGCKIDAKWCSPNPILHFIDSVKERTFICE